MHRLHLAEINHARFRLQRKLGLGKIPKSALTTAQMSTLENELAAILDSSKGERAVAKFLGNHPEILFAHVTKVRSHCDYVLREFSIHGKFFADAVVISANSSGFTVTFIELEPVVDPLFTKKGVPGKRLNGAYKQVHDWMEYIAQENHAMRRALSESAMTRDLLGRVSANYEPANAKGWRLKDVDTRIFWRYEIIIGRRDSAPIKTRNLMTDWKADVHVRTYDGLLEAARIAGNKGIPGAVSDG